MFGAAAPAQLRITGQQPTKDEDILIVMVKTQARLWQAGVHLRPHQVGSGLICTHTLHASHKQARPAQIGTNPAVLFETPRPCMLWTLVPSSRAQAMHVYFTARRPQPLLVG